MGWDEIDRRGVFVRRGGSMLLELEKTRYVYAGKPSKP